MKTILAKTFGGWIKPVTFANYSSEHCCCIFYHFHIEQSPTAKLMPVSAMFYFDLNKLLYPYSKFVWDSVKDFLMGNTVITLALTLFFWSSCSLS